MKSSQQQLLQLLSDGDFHSGADIGHVLGVSRAAVWKQLQRLSSLGLSVESVKGRGYRLPNGLELLHKSVLEKYLAPEYKQRLECCEVLGQVESTNTQASQFSLSSSARGYACLAEYQSAGKGRRGRQWLSPYGANIYLSIAWQFDEGMAVLEGLSLAVGVVIANLLEGLGVEGVFLKWPNDILVQQRKLGGVLVEASGDPLGVCQVVVGVGINMNMSESSAIDQPWICLRDIAPQLSRNQLAGELIGGLVDLLSTYPEKGFAQYQNQWCEKDAYKGQSVRVSSAKNHLEGVSEGVSSKGALLLRVGDDLQAIHGGEVSLRRLHAAGG